MFITADQARVYLADIEYRYHQKQEIESRAWGANLVSDNDEDYVFNALFEVSNI